MKAFSSSNPRALLTTKAIGLLTTIILALLPFGSTLMALACHTSTVDANSTKRSAEKTQDVFVILKDFSITSSLTTFAQGVHYHFLIANGGKMTHELMISPPIMDPDMPMGQMDNMALASVQNIHSGEIKTLDYTFTKAYPQGALELACHMMDHYQKGMHTPIRVDAHPSPNSVPDPTDINFQPHDKGDQTQNVLVILKEFSITSSLTTFAQGIHYHFFIANGGKMTHELMISPPMMDPNMTMKQMDNMALASVQNIHSGEIKTLNYTFTKAYPQGALELACHMMDHYQKGMHTPIRVDAS